MRSEKPGTLTEYLLSGWDRDWVYPCRLRRPGSLPALPLYSRTTSFRTIGFRYQNIIGLGSTQVLREGLPRMKRGKKKTRVGKRTERGLLGTSAHHAWIAREVWLADRLPSFFRASRRRSLQKKDKHCQDAVILRTWGAALLRPYKSSRIWTCQGFDSIRRRARVMGKLSLRGPALPGFR